MCFMENFLMWIRGKIIHFFLWVYILLFQNPGVISLSWPLPPFVTLQDNKLSWIKANLKKLFCDNRWVILQYFLKYNIEVKCLIKIQIFVASHLILFKLLNAFFLLFKEKLICYFNNQSHLLTVNVVK